MSLISLVDDDRQWFKARLGFDPTETSLEESVCSHAILQDGILEIEDMSADARTVGNRLHTEGPQVQFYAGANLVAPNGVAIGTLCVLDTKPRKLNEFQRQALRTLSRQVMTQLELRKRLREEHALRSEIDHRVKNSLQTIASIMRMATRGITDPQALDVLALVERRLGAVASLHSELMNHEGDGTVQTRPYLERVVKLLDESAPSNVTISLHALDTDMDARKASALGMIISEFVANSIKHAFPDGRDGMVSITLGLPDRTEWVLECVDNGIGQTSDETAKPASRDTGLGERLMSSAAIQLDGRLEYEARNSGTAMTVRFPL